MIFHTTFHLSDAIYECGLDYLRKTYIPCAVSSGKLSHPRLQRVLTDYGAAEGVSVAVQFRVADTDTLDEWMRTEGTSLQLAMKELFQDGMVGFSTLLEELEL